MPSPLDEIAASVVPVDLRFGLKMIPLPEEVIAKMVGLPGPVFQRAEVPAGIYKGNKGTIPTVGQGLLCVTRADLTEDFVYSAMKALYDDPEVIKKTREGWRLYKLFGDVENAFFTANVIPMHVGAAKYWTEKKVDLKAKGITVLP